MTSEIPAKDNTRCTSCGNKIQLTKDQRGSLTMGCNCGHVGVRVDSKVPDGWEL
jgi:predicted RNA-binding Zn-ribbon protein involved in translation (DUF1610 family)